jgi:hypothetical protein
MAVDESLTPQWALRFLGHGARAVRRMGLAACAMTFLCLLPIATWLWLAVDGHKPWEGAAIGPPLVGYVDAPAAPARTVFDHVLQEKIQRDFATGFIFKPLLVRLNNQLDYALLRTSRMYEGRIIIGKGGVLYEKAYIEDNHNYGRVVSDVELQEVVGDLVRLRDALSRRGIALAVVGAPNKATLLPNAVPGWYPFLQPKQERPYARAARMLRAAGVPFYDGRQAVLDYRGKSAMFPRGGTHWTVLAAYTALDAPVADLIARQTGQPGRMVVDNVTHQRPFVGVDGDLLGVINLLRPVGPYGSDVVALHREGPALPRPIVLVGSSYLGLMHWVLEQAKVAPQVIELRYLAFAFPCATCDPKPVPADWPNLVASASAVIVEMNETVFFLDPYRAGYMKRFIDGVAPAGSPTPNGPPEH